eukprot:15361605-Ditylum_brightwellii.AAC.1
MQKKEWDYAARFFTEVLELQRSNSRVEPQDTLFTLDVLALIYKMKGDTTISLKYQQDAQRMKQGITEKEHIGIPDMKACTNDVSQETLPPSSNQIGQQFLEHESSREESNQIARNSKNV